MKVLISPAPLNPPRSQEALTDIAIRLEAVAIERAQKILAAERSGLNQALEAISSLWPEPPHCAPIVEEWIGPNDGKMRALMFQQAINIARKALGKPEDTSGQ